ncbi:MAG: transposase, partial [Candidatus Latescibacteria bacterium]|nr:transposase [Candidatus Latescibacterota bacterium]
LLAPEAASAVAAVESIITLLPPGLIIFDRGFNNRTDFKPLLDQGPHLLCRARKNAAFYSPAPPPKTPRRGQPKLYGKRGHFEHWRSVDLYVPALGKTVSVAHQVVRTQGCPVPVRLVVVRTRPHKRKPSRSFLVYTTDLTLAVETIVRYDTLRWTFETGMPDKKESFGVDHYQVRSEIAIQRSVFLSFVAASLPQMLAFVSTQPLAVHALPPLVDGLRAMHIQWYHPKRWTLGLITCYIRWHHHRQRFSASFSAEKTQRKKNISSYRATG